MPFELDSFGKTEQKSAAHIWLETLIICSITIIIGIWLRPSDPFYTGSDAFPWPLVAPILVGVRYGFSQGFVAAIILIASSHGLAWVAGQSSWGMSEAYGLGVLLVAMLVGEFRDIWERRLKKLEISNEYRQARLEEFTRTYHILKISHDRLEQESAGEINSLRNAMYDLRSELAVADSDRRLQAIAPKITEIFRQYGVLQLASLHAVENDRAHAVAIESIGDLKEINPNDMLVQNALREKHMISVRANIAANLDSRDETDYAACVPLVDSDRCTRALLVIKQMPFFSFNDINLKLLAIIAGRIADILRSASDTYFVEDEKRLEFIRQIKRSIVDAKHYGLNASVLAFTATSSASEHSYLDTIQQQMRGLDLGFTTQVKTGEKCLIMLMPLTGEAELAAYMVRFGEFLSKAHGISVDNAALELNDLSISAATTVEDIHRFFVDDIQLQEAFDQEFEYLSGAAA